VRLEINDLTVQYGVVRAVQSVSLSLNEAEITAIVGLNGAGKSSLMRAVVGLVSPAGGEITYLDQDATRIDVLAVRPWLRPERFGIAYVPTPRRRSNRRPEDARSS
jgi:branched-chain amino acid transport system ATP-binding protein